MDFESVATFLAQKGQPGFRSRQVEQAVTQGFAQSYDEITSLPLGLRAELTESVPLLDLSVEEVQRSQDGTIKVRFSARDGFPVEAVAMRHRNRRTVCVSSQSGCPLACTFCATGDMGLGRNLTSGEILEQVLVLARLLRDEDSATVAFAHCPFRELAEANPDLVCSLHRGLVEGFVEVVGDGEVDVIDFHTLVDRTPCQVELAGGGGST